MPGLEPVYKVTILPRGRTGGHALVVPEDDKSLMTRSEMIARLVMAMGGRAAEELVFAEPTTGASSDIAQATKIARAMVTEYGMCARLGAVKYGHGTANRSSAAPRAAGPSTRSRWQHEIDGEVRALIEAAHTEAWEVLNTYRDILDELAVELLEKETLNRRDLERIFAEVEKRPRITTFDEFGGRMPSDQPPIKTPGELAIERGEPWPPQIEPAREPTPVGSYPGGAERRPAARPRTAARCPTPGPPGGGYPGQPPYPPPGYQTGSVPVGSARAPVAATPVASRLAARTSRPGGAGRSSRARCRTTTGRRRTGVRPPPRPASPGRRPAPRPLVRPPQPQPTAAVRQSAGRDRPGRRQATATASASGPDAARRAGRPDRGRVALSVTATATVAAAATIARAVRTVGARSTGPGPRRPCASC